MVKQTAGSWLLVRFARGGETKARPSQLRALKADEALTEQERRVCCCVVLTANLSKSG